MEDFPNLIERYQTKGILIDTNLLLVVVVGICDKNRLSSFKRTKQYSIEDYEILISVAQRFNRIVTTPNVLTEVSNLLGQLSEDLSVEFFTSYSKQIGNLTERYRESSILASNPFFTKFGLTDSSIIEEAKNSYLVLTDDFKLFGYLISQQIDAINFNHLRMVKWFS